MQKFAPALASLLGVTALPLLLNGIEPGFPLFSSCYWVKISWSESLGQRLVDLNFLVQKKGKEQRKNKQGREKGGKKFGQRKKIRTPPTLHPYPILARSSLTKPLFLNPTTLYF
jgi:hypothetical protein